MKAAVLKGIEKIEIEDRPVPEATDHDVLIKVACTGICGTDLGAYRSLSLPAGTVMGHEFAGVVEAVGENVADLKKGDRVTVRPCSVCFKCPWCMEDRISLCPDHLEDTVGLKNVDGAYAEYTLVHDYQVFKLDNKITMEQACQFEPLAVAVHAVEESDVKADDRVLIIGAGSIGLLVLEYVKYKGAKEIVVMEKSPFRLAKAASLGAQVANSQEELDKITETFPRRGFDVVIETAGKPATVSQSLAAVAKGGQVTWVGLSTEPITLDHFHTVASGIHISCSMGYFVEHWDIAMKIVEEGAVDLDGMITAEFPLDEIENGFRALMNPEENLKIIIRASNES